MRLAKSQFSLLRLHFLHPKSPFGYLMLQLAKSQVTVRMQDPVGRGYTVPRGFTGKETGEVSAGPR